MIDKSTSKNVTCSPEDLLSRASDLKEQGAELLFIECRRETEDEIIIDYTFDLNGVQTIITTHTEEGSISSLYSLYPAADFPEREAAILFHIKFVGNPNLATMRIPGSDEGDKNSS
ncbi:MAG: NADH-quinone oxidoreductase subunit C [Candidatus Eremiobacteraeota bacterium]|nr:NADH-quinone oxidoreductase subunit C [Candidatus Eremiobacteraeota bacterium]